MKPPIKEYYQILDIRENATEQEIKKSYRQLALKYHPDRNPSSTDNGERFKDITEAYGVLMDPVKRREYDLFRKNSFSEEPDFSWFNYSQQEIFENMFRQGFGHETLSELNHIFKQAGYRFGNSFFETALFGGMGVAGSLGKLLSVIPGPIGRVGKGLRLLQMVGTSLYTFNKMRKNPSDKPIDAKTKDSSLNLDFNFQISPTEARGGAKKQLTYKIDGREEKLMVTIPAQTKDGAKLRIASKGKERKLERGDLILNIVVKPS